MPTPTTPTTLNEALAEIEVLNTQVAYLQEQAAIASAITNKEIPDYSTVLNNMNTELDTIADNTTPPAPSTPASPPPAPTVNTGYVKY
jgi:hypothetical protein